MLLPLAIATLAIALGVALGLAPVVGRRALGPLRTLALSAVLAVVILHLLPEALGSLGLVGVLVFALGLLVPRWLTRTESHARPAVHRVGLELGFWGLVAHHVGDGLALGAYSRVDEGTGHAHHDVLLALVLHTVPLVAVVATGYARALGPKSAVRRSAVFVLASAGGIVAAGVVPNEVVERTQAWIAAAVAALLLHGMSHDLTEDLPQGTAARGLDLLAAAAGVLLSWLGATLDVEHGSGKRILDAMLESALSLALPLLLALCVGAVLDTVRRRRNGVFARLDALRAGGVGVESVLLSVTQFGFACALAVHAAFVLVLAPARVTAADRLGPAPAAEAALRSFARLLGQRLDANGVWALAGVIAAAVIQGSLPRGAISGVGNVPALIVAALLAIGLALPGAAAVPVAFALWSRGLGLPGALCFCVLSPVARCAGWQRRLLAAIATAVVFGFAGEFLSIASYRPDATLSWAALLALVGLALWRVYDLGLRAWVSPLVATHVHGPRVGSKRTGSEPLTGSASAG